MTRRGAWLFFALVALAAGCDESGSLVVQVRSDLTPALEMSGVGVDIEGRGTPGVWDVFVPAEATDDWATGVRLAQLDLPSGEYRLRIGAEDLAGDLIVQRPVSVRVEGGVHVVTALLTRACTGVMCPAANPAETACLAGRCVTPECTEENPEACAPAECTSVAECPAPMHACARSECTASGACVVLPSSSACDAGEVCSTLEGCRPVGPIIIPPDAGPRDAGPEPDAGPISACGPGDPLVRFFGGPLVNVPQRVALASDGNTVALFYSIRPDMSRASVHLTTRLADGSLFDTMTLEPSTSLPGAEVDIEYGLVGAALEPVYQMVWTVDGVLHWDQVSATTGARTGSRASMSGRAFAAPSVAWWQNVPLAFGVLTEGDSGILYVNLRDGNLLGVSPIGPLEDSMGGVHSDPYLFFTDGLFAALWMTDDATTPLRFVALDPEGRDDPFGPPAPLSEVSERPVSYAATWNAAGLPTAYMWTAVGHTGDAEVELRRRTNGGGVSRQSTSSTDEIAVSMRAAQNGERLALVWFDPNTAGTPELYFMERGNSGSPTPRTSIHEYLDSSHIAEPTLFVDDLIFAGGVYYAAIRASERIRVLRICPAPL